MDAILSPKVLLQILILTFGIYLLLSFLRTTRGSGLVSGVSLILIVGVYGMGLVAQTYELVEIEGIIAGLQAVVFVIIAIIFHPSTHSSFNASIHKSIQPCFLSGQRWAITLIHAVG